MAKKLAKILRAFALPRGGSRVKKKGKRTGGRRTRADIVLAQGTGRVPRNPFGARRRATGLEGWDAFNPAHLPLPRSTGKYTVTRTTALFTSAAKVNIFGTFAQHETGFGDKNFWTTIGLMTSVNSALPVSADSNAQLRSVPFPGASTAVGNSLSAVPAAISVQVMNPNALLDTAGIVAGSVCTTQLDLRGRAETWDVFATEYISFMRPRLMSAGKLALRGVQLDSYPLNMQSIADFRAVLGVADTPTTWNLTNKVHPEGWAPLVIINQAATDDVPLVLNFLVTVEWRTRFDIGNPAVGSHAHHGVTTDSHWDGLMRQAASRGAGVMDIAERVANIGADIGQAAGGLAAITRAYPLPRGFA